MLGYLKEQGFDDESSHVWEQHEIESYLFLPTALAKISAKPMDEVSSIVSKCHGRNKKSLMWLLGTLGVAGTPYNVIMNNALRNAPDELAEEIKRDLIEKIKKKL